MCLHVRKLLENLKKPNAIEDSGGSRHADNDSFHVRFLRATIRLTPGKPGRSVGSYEVSPISIPSPAQTSPLKNTLSAVLALLIGFGILALFIPPREWVLALEQVPRRDLGLSALFFAAGCLAICARWRACLAYRVGFGAAFHSQGIAMAGNLLIPSRVGEALRVYALTRYGVLAEYGTSAVVQERLADQLFRIFFFAAALMVGEAGGRGRTDFQLLGIILATLAVFGALALMVRYRVAMAGFSGRWIGRLPKLNASLVERFVRNTLHDLGSVWTRPGGPAALSWGLAAWVLYTCHMILILPAFFPGRELVLALVVMSFGSPTTAGKPGGYHLVLTAVLMAFSADQEPALRAIVVLFFFQIVFYCLWGMASWFSMKASPTVNVPAVEAASQ